MMIIGKNLSLTKKKLDSLKVKMCKGVRLRRVKVKGFVHKRQMREKTICTDLSSKVMDTCLWHLDSGCSRHMIED